MSGSFTRAALIPVPREDCGKYTLIARLGSGGMAEVFLALVSGLAGFRKIVVIKRLHPHLMEDPEFVTMFMDEARLAARLNHPNVVQTHEVGEANSMPFLAMEHLEGQSFGKLMKAAKQAGGLLPSALAVEIVIGALKGLHYAHELQDFDGTPLGVVHRDISPTNVFITYHGDVKILDFGIAKAATKMAVTRAGSIKGKFAYMSPEQAVANKVDRRADLWSMGVCLYQAVTGRRLFRGKTDIEILEQVLSGDVSKPMKALDDHPPELRAALEKALSPRPDDRYQSADEMRRALQDVSRVLPHPGGDLSDYIGDLFSDTRAGYQEAVSALLQPGGVSNISGLPDRGERRLDSEHPTRASLPGADITPTPPQQTHVTEQRPRRGATAASEIGLWIAFAALLVLVAATSYMLFQREIRAPAPSPVNAAESGASETR